MEDDDHRKRETGGADIVLNLLERGRKNQAVEKRVLEYNNKEPESTLEQVILPKERVVRKSENPESDDLEFDLSELDADVLRKIETNKFDEYTRENVFPRSFWGKKLTPDQIMSYSKSIHGPILNLSKEVASLAMKNFKRVVAIINEKVTKTAAVNIIKRIIKMAVKNSAELRDEVFFQIIKQVRFNYRQECCYQAWDLLCVISCYITPSETAVYPILNYLKGTIETNRDEEIRRCARFSLVRIMRGFLSKGRGVLPCTSEIEAIKKKQKLSCRIYLFTGGFLTVYFENYTVISDILRQICEMMEIDREHHSKFGLFEVATKQGGIIEETFVEDFIKVGDVIASWEHERLFYQRKLGTSIDVKFSLYFKLRFFYPLDKSDFNQSLLIYNECCYMFKNCHCNIDDEELTELMGLHLQIFFGDHSDAKAEEIRKYLYEQIPRHDAKFTANKEDMVLRILARYAEKKGQKRHDCRMAFIDILAKQDSYLRNYYRCKVDSLSQDLHELKDSVVLALGETNMRILTDKYGKSRDIDYIDMQKWGFSDVLFTLLFGKKEEVPSKLVLQTTLSTCISHSLTTYAENMMGISPKENNLVASATSKMIIAATEFFKRVNKYELARLEDEDSEEELVAETRVTKIQDK